MKRLLWVGDACVSTGFARATHYTLETLRKYYEVEVIGMNYRGNPHKWPYGIHTCTAYGDHFGVNAIGPISREFQPDLIVLQNDVWNIPYYIEALARHKIPKIPLVASLAVDGKNVQGQKLHGVDLAIFWTEFAKTEAELGGWAGKSTIIPLGVDLNIYQPMNRPLIRKAFEIQNKGVTVTDKSFIVGNVNRNQPRKRLDLTVEYFCRWVDRGALEDVFLFMHASPTGEDEFDLPQLMEYYGHREKLLLSIPEIGVGVSERAVAATYNAFDIQVTTTQGEGFGLTTFEGMACGTPQIVPDWSALGELCGDAALKVPCDHYPITGKGINAIGATPDRESFIEALDLVYKSRETREELSRRGTALVAEDRFRWSNIGERFAAVLEETLAAAKAAEPVEATV